MRPILLLLHNAGLDFEAICLHRSQSSLSSDSTLPPQDSTQFYGHRSLPLLDSIIPSGGLALVYILVFQLESSPQTPYLRSQCCQSHHFPFNSFLSPDVVNPFLVVRKVVREGLLIQLSKLAMINFLKILRS